MIGQEYYCKYVQRGKIVVLLEKIVAVDHDNGLAKLSNGKTIYLIDGRERFGEKYWYPSYEDQRFIDKFKLAQKARRWLRAMMQSDDIAILLWRQLHSKTGMYHKGYFHELSDSDRNTLGKYNMYEIQNYFCQPRWCGNNLAMSGAIGCRKLLTGKIKKHHHCIFCKYHVPPHNINIARIRNLLGIRTQFMTTALGDTEYDLIESGEKTPTDQQINYIKEILGIDRWTLDQVDRFHRTPATEDVKDDVLGEESKYINLEFNSKTFKNEKKSFKF